MSLSPGRRTVLVVQPDHEDPLELFDSVFRSSGVAATIVRPFDGEPVPRQVEADGLVVLGGDMGANDDHEYPWLADVRHLLRVAVDEQVPTLGICLGGQLLAAACGGTVARGEAGVEVGAVPIDPRPEASDDSLVGQITWPATYATMHRDAIVSLPTDAVWLAESGMYPHQAFRLGQCAWGLQFHPEVSLSRFRRWADHLSDDAETSRRMQHGTAEFALNSRQVAVSAHELATGFARILREHEGVPHSPSSREPTA
ncbi:type 1 glutamine amidotransferase [Nocardioides sp. NPDC006303]|uniref:type 1 glutamine amidotransferase n=1 Tax=Nocardioides sp. NPDC006303 TaxID=3156747 RepID=UPI0033BC27D3